MREIKFRAWDKENKIFHYFTLFDIWKNIKYPTHVVTNNEVYYIKDLPIDQYTGLKDKNGKEIYEGDVLGVKTRKRNKKYQFTHIIEWKELELYGGLWTGDGYDFPPWDSHIEIIGNIYENPELAE